MTEVEAEQLYQRGLEAFRRGDNTTCRRLSEQALLTARKVGSRRVEALGHIGMSRACFREAEYADGLEHALSAAELARECGADREATTALHMRAEIRRAQGRYEDSVPLYEELLQLEQAAEDQGALAMEHYNLASVLLQVGALDEAEAHLSRSLERVGIEDSQLPYTVLGFAGVQARRGDVALAGRLVAGVQDHFAAVGEVLDPAEELELASHVTAARRRDSVAFDEGLSAPVTPEEAHALLRASVG